MDGRNVEARWRALSPHLLSLLRIVAAWLFIQYGTTKLFEVPASIVPGGGTVPLASQGGVGSLLELIGGAFLLVGLFSRPIAFVLSGEMAVAYLIGHAGPQGWWLFPVVNGGAPAAIFAFVWLYVSAAGPGPWSLDAWREDASRVPAAAESG
ncbi:MAG TPA: DoxX family protein [Gemmatimonadota bacterium]|jgi:putative oxidoreductase